MNKGYKQLVAEANAAIETVQEEFQQVIDVNLKGVWLA